MSNYHTFTEDGLLPDVWEHRPGQSTIRLGKEGASDLGTGTLSVLIQTQDGGYHVVREITDLGTLENNSIVIEQPTCSLSMRLEGATNPNFYVEFQVNN